MINFLFFVDEECYKFDTARILIKELDNSSFIVCMLPYIDIGPSILDPEVDSCVWIVYYNVFVWLFTRWDVIV